MINFIHIPKAAGSSFLNLAGFNEHFNYCGHAKAASPSLAITRHPYDRLISAYVYLMNGGGQNELDLSYKNTLSMYPDFKSFVFSLRSDNLTERILHLKPMEYFVCDNGVVTCDRIFRIEDVGEIDAFLSTLNMPPLSEKFVNMTDVKHYTEYLSGALLYEINTLYAKDFELFNYKMI